MKNSMRKRINVFLILLVCSTLLAQSLFAQTEGEFAVPLSDPGKRGVLTAKLNTGAITIRGTARKDILVKYQQVDDSKSKDKAESNRDGLKRISSGTMDLEVTEDSNQVKVSSGSWNNTINLFIEVPSGFDLKVKAYNDGDVVISDVQGEVEITSYNGGISAKNISGSVVASTYNGDIEVTFNTVTSGTPMSYTTYNGDIDVTFPSSFKGSLKLKTEQGEIFTGFDVNLIKSGPIKKSETKSGTYRVVIDDWVKGDVNGGGPEFTMKNYNGDILIRKK